MPPKKRAADSDVEAKQKRRKKKPTNSADPGFGEEEVQEKIKLEGPLLNGEVLICGGTNWDLVGRRQAPKGVKNIGGPNLWGPHRILALKGIKVRSVVSGCTACHSLVITTEGKVFSWGRNDKAQLGQGDILRRDVPTLVECLQDFNIVEAACGRNHSLCLSESGVVYAFGDNTMGQLGLGHQSPSIPSPTQIVHKGPPIRRVACGAEFSMVVDIRGNLYSFGSPEYGQTGHNTDGKYFVTSNKLAYKCDVHPRKILVFVEKMREGNLQPVMDVEIMDVACGTNHTIAMDKKKRIFTWGFGGYGRLGHAEQKDELVPRMVKMFDGPNRGAEQIAAGSSFTMAVNELGALYLWGQNKPTGDAAMYPKPVHDLGGWKVHSIGCCNKSIVVVADESVVSWGPSPTYGELGYGPNKPKSSSQPTEVKTLGDIHIHRVACGYGHTLMLARNDTEDDEKALSALPEFTPDLLASA